MGDHIAGLRFIIQSESKDPLYLDGRIEDFIVTYREKTLEPMTDDVYEVMIL